MPSRKKILWIVVSTSLFSIIALFSLCGILLYTTNAFNANILLCDFKRDRAKKLEESSDRVFSKIKLAKAALNVDQSQNVKAIEEIAKSYSYDTTVVIAAIDAALTESDLVNLAYGDRDSLGLFQMRPSQGWGNKEEILNISFSIEKMLSLLNERYVSNTLFYSEHPDVLIQLVERSAYPERYSKNYEKAAAIHSAYLANHLSVQSTSFKERITDRFDRFKLYFDYSVMNIIDNASKFLCENLTQNPSGNLPLEGDDNQQISSQDAYLQSFTMKKAYDIYRTKNYGWYNRCLAFVEEVYGVSRQYGTALAFYDVIDSRYKHSAETLPKNGALLFFETNNPAGHVAIAINQEIVLSTDIPNRDKVGFTNLQTLQEDYKFKYLGWADPNFP
jgi:hypothetical protein